MRPWVGCSSEGRLLAQADAEGDLDWVVAVDSTIVRARQHAAGARQEASYAIVTSSTA
ncbi:hypothetical protein ACIPY6_43505 [Streptomyces sp. NPDC090054]